MDGSSISPDPTPTTEWAASRIGGAALGVGGIVLVVAAFATSSDPAGMVLMGVAGLLLLGFSAHALLIRPRLAVKGGPTPRLTIRGITGTQTYTPDQIERIRVLSIRRVGRRTGQLELDLPDDSLVVFGRWDLGSDLVTVADTLRHNGFNVDDR